MWVHGRGIHPLKDGLKNGDLRNMNQTPPLMISCGRGIKPLQIVLRLRNKEEDQNPFGDGPILLLLSCVGECYIPSQIAEGLGKHRRGTKNLHQ